MSSSRENSPDWLRSFEAPTKTVVTLSSGSESSLSDSPSRDEEKNENELSPERTSQFPKEGEDQSRPSSGKTLVSRKSPVKKLKQERSPVKKKNVRGNKGDAESVKQEKSEINIEEPISSVWALSSSDSDSPTSPKKRETPKGKSPKKGTKTNDIVPKNKKELNSDDIKKEGNDGGMEAAEEDVGEKRSESRFSSSRLPLVLSDKVSRSKALVECEGDSIDLSGDVGAVGRVVVSDEMYLDLKGTIYKTTIVPSRTFCVVSFGPSEAKDGMTWVLNPPDESLAFILVDNGFDVWITNTRGTRFSNRHITLKPNNPDFWNWTWDDLVTHDLPAVIDFVFKQTDQKINYVGHSLGTLVALASFSERREVEKVKSAALLSPIAYLSHMTTAIGEVAARTFVGEFTKLFGLAEFNPIGKPVINLVKTMCAQPGIDCYDLLSAFTGKNCCLNSSTIDLFLKNEPQPTSTKNMVHLAQTVRDGKLSKYDYGNTEYNLEHYGERKPPSYNLSNIPNDLPLFLSYGGKDALSDVRDVQILLDSLKLHDPNKISIQYIEHFAHADFIMGVTAKDLVYNQVLKFFREQK